MLPMFSLTFGQNCSSSSIASDGPDGTATWFSSAMPGLFDAIAKRSQQLAENRKWGLLLKLNVRQKTFQWEWSSQHREQPTDFDFNRSPMG